MLYVSYSATVPKTSRPPHAVVHEMSEYLARLFGPPRRVSESFKNRITARIYERLADSLTRRTGAVVLSEQEYREYIATMEVLEDPSAMGALHRAAAQSDDDARSYDEIRRELGLA